MIKSLRLKNFQSHKNTFIEFDEGVNVIIGENDSGKSSILRAVNLVINNRPAGEDFRSAWGGDTEVSLDIGDQLISRIRTDKENSYTLKGIKEPFKAFGRGVPDIIKKHLNISPVNLAFQLDRPFLLEESFADVAKFYNKIVNIDIIDKTISNIASILREEKTSFKTKKQQEENLNEKLKEYEWIADAENQLSNLEQAQQNINKTRNDWSKLCGLINDLKDLEKEKNELNKITKFENILLGLINKTVKIDELKNDCENFISLIKELHFLQMKADKLNQLLQHKNQVNSLIEKLNDIKKGKQAINSFENNIYQWKKYLKAEKKYNNLVIYDKQVNSMITLDDEIEKNTDEYNELYDFIDKKKLLIQNSEKMQKNIENLELKFKKIMPNTCPIFDVSCDYINKKRGLNVKF